MPPLTFEARELEALGIHESQAEFEVGGTALPTLIIVPLVEPPRESRKVVYLAGAQKAAEEAIPEEYLANSSLIGPEGFVRERLHALKDSGVTSLNINLMGQEVGERVTQLEKLRNLVDSM